MNLERISSLNWYFYVEGNPVSYLDPFGLLVSIYDDFHIVLQGMLEVYAYLSVVSILLSKVPIVGKYASITIAASVLLTTLADFGVCIGRAWECDVLRFILCCTSIWFCV